MKAKKIDTIDIIQACVIAVMLYAIAAGTTFALRHPELTQTQRLIHFFDAMTWQKLDEY